MTSSLKYFFEREFEHLALPGRCVLSLLVDHDVLAEVIRSLHGGRPAHAFLAKEVTRAESMVFDELSNIMAHEASMTGDDILVIHLWTSVRLHLLRSESAHIGDGYRVRLRTG